MHCDMFCCLFLGSCEQIGRVLGSLNTWCPAMACSLSTVGGNQLVSVRGTLVRTETQGGLSHLWDERTPAVFAETVRFFQVFQAELVCLQVQRASIQLP